MHSIALDPFVLAVPEGTGSAELEAYVLGILEWRSLQDEGWVSICLSARGMEILSDESCYPLFEPLRDAFRRSGIDLFDVNTVVQVANFLLMQAPQLEERCGLRDVLFDPCNVVPHPPAQRTRLALGAELHRCLLLIATAVTMDSDGAGIIRIATRGSHCTGIPRQARVHGTAVLRELFDGRALDTPLAVDQHIDVCESFDEFLLGLDASLLWRTDPSDVGIRTAVRIAVVQRARAMGEAFDWDATDRFRVGCEFAESLRRYGFGHEISRIGPLLVAMVATVRGELQAREHVLRTGAGAADPQRMRGPDSAWRRDITYEFHLHYWRTAHSIPEFGCVGPHNHFDIPYCR